MSTIPMVERARGDPYSIQYQCIVHIFTPTRRMKLKPSAFWSPRSSVSTTPTLGLKRRPSFKRTGTVRGCIVRFTLWDPSWNRIKEMFIISNQSSIIIINKIIILSSWKEYLILKLTTYIYILINNCFLAAVPLASRDFVYVREKKGKNSLKPSKFFYN